QLASTATFQRRDLSGISLRNINWSDADFSNQNLTDTNFEDTILVGANFQNAIVTGTDFEDTTLTAEQLYSTASYAARNLQRINLEDLDMTGWDLSGQDLRQADLKDANLSSAILRDAVFTDADMRFVNLSGADLTNAHLSQWMRGADLTGATLMSTVLVDLRNVILTAATAHGLTAEQVYATSSYQDESMLFVTLADNDLSEWNFSNQLFYAGDLRNAKLTGANLTGATFVGTALSGVDLTDADVEYSRLLVPEEALTWEQLMKTATFQRRSLEGVELYWELQGRDLSGLNLANSRVTFAAMDNADLRGANLAGANLSNALGVEQAIVDETTTYDQYTVFEESFDPVASGMTFKPSADGDFNGDGKLDHGDLLTMRQMIRWSERDNYDYFLRQFYFTHLERGDLDGDQLVTETDVTEWIHRIKRTWLGDANLDGVFDSADLVAVFTANLYESPFANSATWDTGDWNLDGKFTSSDLVAAFVDGGYESGTRGARVVPEPSTGWLACGMLVLGARRRRGYRVG
ncbi:MAG: pentapeptide repeat-containing protein, partial [Planctomycetales bacterium]|nr:pentapeptide repeat-containing protein [Planctomycetales bacterium]